jgi:hypothetical protein
MEGINIRSITYSVNLNKIKSSAYQENVKKNITELIKNYSSQGTLIRTVRLNTLAIENHPKDDKIFIEEVKILSNFIQTINIRWFNIAFDLTYMSEKDQIRISKLAYYIIKKFDNAFINLIIAKDNEINTSASLVASNLIMNVSKLSTNGFDNFRVGISL